MRRTVRPILLAATCAATLIALSGLAAGQGSSPSPALAGRWVYQGDPAAGQRQIDRVVDPAIAGLSFDMQDMARERIAETAFVPPFIEVNASAASIAITYGGERGRTFQGAPGIAENVFSASGVRASSTLTVRPDGTLEHRLRAADGTQVNHLALENGNLVLRIHMESVRFSRPVDFRLPYRR